MTILKRGRKKRVKIVSTATTPPAKPKLRSGFEGKVKKSLEASKVSFEYESERIPYTIPKQEKKYIPDFIVKTKSGKTIYIEAKGRWVAADRKKIELVLAQNPEKDIRLLFMRDNFLRKGSKTKYSDWCERKGIKYAVSFYGHVPQEWLEE